MLCMRQITRRHVKAICNLEISMRTTSLMRHVLDDDNKLWLRETQWMSCIFLELTWWNNSCILTTALVFPCSHDALSVSVTTQTYIQSVHKERHPGGHFKRGWRCQFICSREFIYCIWICRRSPYWISATYLVTEWLTDRLTDRLTALTTCMRYILSCRGNHEAAIRVFPIL